MKIFGLLILLIAGAVLAAVYLPWWAVVGGMVLLIVAIKFLGGRIIVALFKMPFKAKSAVLRGATAEVHSLSPVTRLAQDDAEHAGDKQEDANRRSYLLEVTITPAARESGSFQLWEPGELQLVGPDAKPDDPGNDEPCSIKRMEIESEGKFIRDEGMKYGGPQRLRLTIAADPGVRQLQFRYYFELFGTVPLPG